MTKPGIDLTAVKVGKGLKNSENWKSLALPSGDGYYNLQTEDTGDVPVRLFLTPTLLGDAEDTRLMTNTQRPGFS